MSTLGKIGEKKFDLWCSEANLTCNKSNEDETGWDYSVEFPLDLGRQGALSHDGAIECKVQVKTTQTSKPTTQITISNLHRFASSPLPCFVVLFMCNQARKVTDVYVRHIDEELASSIIEKTHKLRAAEKLHSLHKKTMVIRFRQADRLKSLEPAALRAALAKPVSNGMHAYSKSKQEFLARCGYTDSCITGQITLTGTEALEKFIDMTIGYVDSLPVQNIKLSRKRFGVEEEIIKTGAKTAIVSINSDSLGHEAIMRVKTGTFESPITFSSTVYIPPLINSIPHKFLAIRVRAGIVDMKLKPYEGSGQFDLDLYFEDAHELTELRNSLWLLKHLYSDEPLSIEIQKTSTNGPSFKSNIRGIQQSFMFGDALEGLDAALKIVRHLGITEQVKLSLKQAQIQSLGLIQTYSLFESKNQVMKIEFSTDSKLDEHKECACIHAIQVPVGDMLIVVVVTLIGLPARMGELRYQVTSTTPIVSKAFIEPNGIELTNEERRLLVGDVQREYEEKYETIAMQS